MKKEKNELYIGTAVAVTILVVVASVVFLEKSSFLQPGLYVNLVVQDAKGMRTGGNIFYEGLKVGAVEAAKFTSNGVLLKLKITGIDSIPDDSRFVIRSTSLIGSPAVQITPGRSASYLENGAYVTGRPAFGMSDILQGGREITDNIDRVVKNVDALTNEETRRRVSNALDNINESVVLIHESLKSNLEEIHSTIRDVKGIAADNRAPIDSMIDRLSRHSLDLAIALKNTERITNNLNQIVAGLNRGRGTAGKLLTDDQLYSKIDSTVTNLNDLIKDIKEHPGKYIHLSIF